MKNKKLLEAIFVLFFIGGCGKGVKEYTITEGSSLPVKTVEVPIFNADSAFAFVKAQVDFGPRVPNTRAHTEAGDFIIEKLKGYGFKVETQEFEATTFDDHELFLRNIIASYSPNTTKRILLAAHWDTRPFADKDPENTDVPIDGANDGGSGVAVLLEIARAINESPNKPAVGVDLIFFDGEDWGELNGGPRTRPPDGWQEWWCLGSQYWSKNKHKAGYSAYYGILLDMVGAKNAQFPIEGFSNKYAGKVTRKVWDWANYLGYGDIFIYDIKQEITDDHKFVNEIGKIPMMNIVHYDDENGFFGDFHHSQKDNLDIIDKNTLKAVGNTVLHVLYHE